jgi:hypothetical protein
MKTILAAPAAVAISLAFAGTALADSVTVTRTGVDAFGNNQSVTRSVDNFGNRRIVISKEADNGFVHCRTVTVRGTNPFGDSTSRTMRRCARNF